jgi:hypothetical protein
MRSVVALVKARPETLFDDYRRVRQLAGLELKAGDSELNLWPCWSGGGFSPGFDSPCWQIAAAAAPGNDPAAQPPCRVHPLGAEGLRNGFPGASSGWPHALALLGCGQGGQADGEFRELQVGAPLPALAAVLPEGFRVPRHFGPGAVLLPTPVLNRSWQLAGAVAQITALVAGKARREKKIPPAEIIAEALALAREALAEEKGIPTMMDAVIWGVHGEDGKPHGLVRNLLIAGQDPLAVDAVAARLAGLDPNAIPWMQLCADRGLGQCAPARVDVRGDEDLLELDLEIPEVTFRTPDRSRAVVDRRGESALEVLKGPGRALGRLGRKDAQAGFSGSGWDHLRQAFAAGTFSPS